MRLFVAIVLDERVRARLAAVQDRLRNKCPGVRWVRPELVHLTLKFLGDVGDGDVSSVVDSVALAAETCEPFDMKVADLGCFPERGPVRIIWAGVRVETGALLRCSEAVEGALELCGFQRERRSFSPHLTLGRVREDRSGAGLREAVAGKELPETMQPVASITLLSSVLSPSGPTYKPVSVAKLGGV